MADYRTKPESELTFYVIFQSKNSFDIFRYDTLIEAINKFNDEKNSFDALIGIGISKNNREIDIVHKETDTVALLTDYLKSPQLKYDREIRQAIEDTIKALDIKWERTFDILKSSAFSSLCVPCTTGNEDILHNEYVDTLSLNPSETDNIITSMEKLYIADEELWYSTEEIMALCKAGNHPQIASIQINVKDNLTAEDGKINVSPNDYLLMADKYLLSHTREFSHYEIDLAFDNLAGDLNDFMFNFDPYEYRDNLPAGGEVEAIDNLIQELKVGNIQPMIDQIASIISEEDIDSYYLLQANELIDRLKKIIPDKEIKQELNHKIKNAENTNKNIFDNKKTKDSFENER